jgi:hypothetical protein
MSATTQTLKKIDCQYYKTTGYMKKKLKPVANSKIGKLQQRN